MKPVTLIALLLTAVISPLRSEENASTQPADSGAEIIGNVPDGSPPPAQLPKPEFKVPSEEILESTTHEQGGRTITIQEIQPIALPPPPVPIEPAPVELNEEMSQLLAEYREAHPASILLMLGATVFQFDDSPPRTLVRYWPHGTGKQIAFWSSADFRLVAGGVQSFTDGAGRSYGLSIVCGNANVSSKADLQKGPNNKYGAPQLPNFAPGVAMFEWPGDQLMAAETAPIQAIHDLYNKNYQQLKSAYEGREQARLEREAALKANPPQPKDITLNYWRTEIPRKQQTGEAAR